MKRPGLKTLVLIGVVAGMFMVSSCGGGGGGSSFDDNMIEFSSVVRNASGYWTKYSMYNSDGSVQYYNIVDRAPNGIRNSWTQFVDAGGDGIWFTNDDVRDSYTLYIYNGTLMMQGNQYDDANSMTGYFFYERDSNGNITLYTVFNGWGGDSTWETGDDIIDFSRETTYDLYQNVEKEIYSDSNSQIDAYYSYQHDINNNLIMRVYYNDPGLNGTWFNTDDVIYSYYTYVNDTNGNRTRRTRLNGAGINGIWMDSDDNIDYYIKYLRDNNDMLYREEWYNGPGPNGVWYLSIQPRKTVQSEMFNFAGE